MCDEWDIDGEGNQGTAESSGRSGVEFYTLVVTYKGAKPFHLIPQIVKIDPNTKQPVKSRYGKDGEFMHEDGKREVVKHTRVVKWSTRKEILQQQMNNEQRTACNAIKTFLSKHPSALS